MSLYSRFTVLHQRNIESRNNIFVFSMKILQYFEIQSFRFPIVKMKICNAWNRVIITAVLVICGLTFFFLVVGKPSHVTTERFRHTQSVVGFIRKCIVFVVVFVLFYWTKRLLSLKVNSKDIIYSKIGQDIFLFAIPSICFGKSRNLICC